MCVITLALTFYISLFSSFISTTLLLSILFPFPFSLFLFFIFIFLFFFPPVSFFSFLVSPFPFPHFQKISSCRCMIRSINFIVIVTVTVLLVLLLLSTLYNLCRFTYNLHSRHTICIIFTTHFAIIIFILSTKYHMKMRREKSYQYFHFFFCNLTKWNFLRAIRYVLL